MSAIANFEISLAADDAWRPTRDTVGRSDHRSRPSEGFGDLSAGNSAYGSGAVRTQELPPIAAPPTNQPARNSNDFGSQSITRSTRVSGLSAADFKEQLARIDRPIRSWSLQPLWTGLLAEAEGADDPAMRLLAAQALREAGALRQGLRVTESGPRSPELELTAAQLRIALGEFEQGCREIKQAAADPKKLSSGAQGLVILYAGYCSARGGQPSGAKLAAQLAREAEVPRPRTIGLLDRIATGQLGSARDRSEISVLDVRLLQLLPGALAEIDVNDLSTTAAVALAIDVNASAEPRIAAAERAAAAGAISAADLVGAYRSIDASARSGPNSTAAERARLWLAIDRAPSPDERARHLGSLIENATRSGLRLAAIRAAATVMPEVRPEPGLAWFAETAAEVAVGSGQLDLARDWVSAADRGATGRRQSPRHWLALADIADPYLRPEARGGELYELERLAVEGRFSANALHRLVTVLDALDYNVPIGLWDAANRTPQPSDGHLPQTGSLKRLADASRERRQADTILLSLESIGRDGPGGAHMLALGETIRALKRAGIEGEARKVAVESVFNDWPRTGQERR